MKCHNGVCTEELFGIRKKVAVEVWKEQMVSTCTKTSSSESLQTNHNNIESTSFESKMSCNKPGKYCPLGCSSVVWQELTCPETARHHFFSVYSWHHFITSSSEYRILGMKKIFVLRRSVQSDETLDYRKKLESASIKGFAELSATYMECGSEDDNIYY